MTARKTTALLLTGAAVWLAGCSEDTAGTPRAAETEPTTATEQTSEPPTSTSGTSDSLADIDPCTLLSDEEKSRLGLRKEEKDSTSSARTCGWIAGTSSRPYGPAVGIRERQGLGDVVGADGPPKPVTVGSHEAREARDTSGESCLVAIGVSDSSRVDVWAAGGDMAQMCETAHELAELVEPKLPEN